MKQIVTPFITLLITLLAGNSVGQSFVLPAPDGWGKETISFPIDFAPDIPYVGTEELRFTPGWGNAKTEEYWSYCFLWMINDDALVDGASLRKHLKSYYDGLVGRNIVSRKIEQSKVVPIISNVEATSGRNANYTYEGTVSMLDYMEQKPITLQIKIHQARCDETKKKVLFVEVSPQSGPHQVWKEFESIWKGFKCKP